MKEFTDKVAVLEMPDGTTSVIIQGKRRYAITEFIAKEHYFKSKIEPLTDVTSKDDNEFNAIVGSAIYKQKTSEDMRVAAIEMTKQIAV